MSDDLLVPMSDDESDDAVRPPRVGRFGIGASLAVLFVVLVVAVLGGRAIIGHFRPADYSGTGTGEVTVQVPRGASATRIGQILHERDVVKSSAAFRRAAESDSRSSSVQPGYYKLRKHMKAKLALSLLLDPKSRIRSQYTIPEGTTVAKTLEIISSKVDGMPIADLRAAADNPAALGLPAYAKGRLEGFLFPATYEVEPGTSAVEVLTAMVDRFQIAESTLDLEKRAASLGRTPYEVLIVASLVEAETPKADQRGKVARVAYNRLAIDMRLQFDSTVQYALAKPRAQLTFKDLEVSSPYNTYRNAGLPPTPINAPGEAAIDAALAPTPGNWLYFVVIDKQSNSAFTADYAEFQRLKAIYKRDVLGQ